MKDTNNQGKSSQERLAEAEERRKNETVADMIARAVKNTAKIIDEQKRVGDAAKLRETLVAVKKSIDEIGASSLDGDPEILMMSLTQVCARLSARIDAALAAPPRNCDRYTTFNDAIRALADKLGWHDGKWNSERYCILAQWLLAPATEKEGGNDAD